MGDKIYVPYQEAESEFVEKRSRFIGHIWPVDSEDQAQELIRRVDVYKRQTYSWPLMMESRMAVSSSPRNTEMMAGGASLPPRR